MLTLSSVAMTSARSESLARADLLGCARCSGRSAIARHANSARGHLFALPVLRGAADLLERVLLLLEFFRSSGRRLLSLCAPRGAISVLVHGDS